MLFILYFLFKILRQYSFIKNLNDIRLNDIVIDKSPFSQLRGLLDTWIEMLSNFITCVITIFDRISNQLIQLKKKVHFKQLWYRHLYLKILLLTCFKFLILRTNWIFKQLHIKKHLLINQLPVTLKWFKMGIIFAHVWVSINLFAV